MGREDSGAKAAGVLLIEGWPLVSVVGNCQIGVAVGREVVSRSSASLPSSGCAILARRRRRDGRDGDGFFRLGR